MTTFRPAVATDALVISLLAEVSFRDTFRKDFKDPGDLDDYCRETFAYPKIKASLAKRTNHFLVLSVDGEIVGYAKLKVAESPVQLQKIYLHSAFTGRGLGGALLAECRRVAREYGGERMWLAVEERNTNAIAFYRKKGFVQSSDFDFRIGSQTFHFLRMSCSLLEAP